MISSYSTIMRGKCTRKVISMIDQMEARANVVQKVHKRVPNEGLQHEQVALLLVFEMVVPLLPLLGIYAS